MSKSFLKFSFIFIFVMAFLVITVNAQVPDASSPDGRSSSNRQVDLPNGIKESLAKKRIQEEENEYKDLIDKGEQAAQLSAELNKSLENNKTLTSDDLKKLDRLEKLVKKIRSDLGAQADDGDGGGKDSSQAIKTSLPTAAQNLQEMTDGLLTEIKKIGRHTISVVAIESSNSLLRLVRFLRFNRN